MRYGTRRNPAPFPSRLAISLVLLLFAVACAGESCDVGGATIGDSVEFPEEQALPAAVQTVVTDDAATFLETRLPSLLRIFLGADATGPIDISPLINAFLAENPLSLGGITIEDVSASVDLPRGDETFDITFLPDPARVRIRVSELHLSLSATVIDAEGSVSWACRIRPDVDTGAPLRQSIVLRDTDVSIELATTEDGTFDFGVTIDDLGVESLGIRVVTDRSDPDFFCNYEVCSDGFSGCAECRALCTGIDLLGLVADFLAALLEDVIRVAADAVADSIAESIGTVKLEVHPAVLLGSLLPSAHDALALRALVGPVPDGLSVDPIPGRPATEGGDLRADLRGGTATEPHPCFGKPDDDPVWPARVPARLASPDAEGERPHVVAAVSDSFLNQLVWSLYRSGTLCVSLEAQTLTELAGFDIDLNANTLGILLPGLSSLAGPTAPLRIDFRPSYGSDDAMLLRFGTGEARPDAEAGDPTSDSLLTMTLPGALIDISTLIDGVPVRVLGLSASVEIGLSVTIDGTSTLQLSLDAVELGEIALTYSELYEEVDFEELLRFVVDIVAQVFLAEPIPIPLDIDELLSTFGELPLGVAIDDVATTGANPAAPTWLEARIRLVDRGLSAGVEARPDATVESPPERSPLGAPLRFVARDALFDDQHVEVQTRIDDGAWGAWRQPGAQRVENALLHLEGTHRVSVRTRLRDLPSTIDPVPFEFLVEIGPARDGAAEAESGEPYALPSIQPSTGTSGAGCAVAATPPSTSFPYWFLVLGALALPRRRSRRRGCADSHSPGRPAKVALLLVGLGAAACGDAGTVDESDLPCEADRDCPPGRFCSCEGLCTVPTTCESSADCCDDAVCQGGRCLQIRQCAVDADCFAGRHCDGCHCEQPSCREDADCREEDRCLAGTCVPIDQVACGGACGEDQICLPWVARCVERGDRCVGVDCAPPDLLVATAPGDNGAVCSETALTCDCVERPGPAPGTLGVEADYLFEPDGAVLVIGYERGFGDLAARRVEAGADRSSDDPPPTYLDGFPGTPTRDGQNPLRGDTAEPGPDVGRSASVVRLDDRVVAAYHDVTARALMVGFGDPASPSWSPFVLDEDGRAGLESDLLADGDQFVAVWEVVAAGRSLVRLGWAPASIAAQAEAWQSVTLDERALESDPLDDVRTRHLAIARTEHGLSVLDHDIEMGSLTLHAGEVDVGFDSVTLASVTPRSGDETAARTGRSAAIASGPGGAAHAVFVDAVSETLLYCAVTTDRSCEPEIVDAGGQQLPPVRLGRASLIVTTDGTPYVLYQDASNADAVLSFREGDGRWDRTVIARTGSLGYSPRVAVVGDRVVSVFGAAFIDPRGRLAESTRIVRLPLLHTE